MELHLSMECYCYRPNPQVNPKELILEIMENNLVL
jgi:hypothetical protein